METERHSPRYSAIESLESRRHPGGDDRGPVRRGRRRAGRPPGARGGCARDRAAAARRRPSRLRRRRHLRTPRGSGRRRADADLQLAAGAIAVADRGWPRGAGSIRRGRRRRERRGDPAGAALCYRAARCADRRCRERDDAVHPRLPARGKTARRLDRSPLPATGTRRCSPRPIIRYGSIPARSRSPGRPE